MKGFLFGFKEGLSLWEWRRPDYRRSQTWLSYQMEQLAVTLLLSVMVNAHARGDSQTMDRLSMVARAGSTADQEAKAQCTPTD